MRKGVAGALKRLALIVGGLLFGLLLAELGFRVLKPLSTQINHRPLVYQPDPVIGYRLIPGSSDYIERYEYRQPVQINSDGFFDDEYPEVPPPGVTRIAAIGDSYTAGFQVGRAYNYPDVLERLLNEEGLPGCPCEVLNFGLDGTGTVQQVAIFEQIALNYQPDIVVVAFHSTDLRDTQVGLVQRDLYRGYELVYRDETGREELTRQVDALLSGGGGALRFAVQHSYLVRVLYNAWLKGTESTSPNLRDNRAATSFETVYTIEEAQSLIVDGVERMAQTCEEVGCEVVFVVIPTKKQSKGEGGPPFFVPITEALAKHGVRRMSLVKPVKRRAAQGEELFFEYDGHFNRDGYQLMAEEIAAHLQQEGLLD